MGGVSGSRRFPPEADDLRLEGDQTRCRVHPDEDTIHVDVCQHNSGLQRTLAQLQNVRPGRKAILRHTTARSQSFVASRRTRREQTRAENLVNTV